MSEIWVMDEDIDELIKDLKNHDESEELYSGHFIDELYIDEVTGALDGFITIDKIGVAVSIPFHDWMRQAKRFKWFKRLNEFCDLQMKQLEQTKTDLVGLEEKLEELYNGSEQSIMEEEK